MRPRRTDFDLQMTLQYKTRFRTVERMKTMDVSTIDVKSSSIKNRILSIPDLSGGEYTISFDEHGKAKVPSFFRDAIERYTAFRPGVIRIVEKPVAPPKVTEPKVEEAPVVVEEKELEPAPPVVAPPAPVKRTPKKKSKEQDDKGE